MSFPSAEWDSYTAKAGKPATPCPFSLIQSNLCSNKDWSSPFMDTGKVMQSIGPSFVLISPAVRSHRPSFFLFSPGSS